MTWEECMESGNAKKSFKDLQRAKSLMRMADSRIKFVRELDAKKDYASILFSDMYESVLEYCQALACLEGFKILNHLCITDFLKELGMQDIAVKFDRYRKLRNSINYYGNVLDPDFSLRSISEMQSVIGRLKQFISEKHRM